MPAARSADPPIRVMIVDDSIVARTVLARMLAERGDFTIAAQVGSAQAALDKLAEVAVDAILLDLEMPGRSGLAALDELIAQSRGARILVVSSAAADGAEASLSALRQGAADTLLKPDASALAGAFADELAIRLRRIVRRADEPVVKATNIGTRPATKRGRPLECIAIGASTGGVPALAAFLTALPRAIRAPILITQHLPAPFLPCFARQLSEIAGRPARIVDEALRLGAGEILLAPGDAHLMVARTHGLLHVRPDRAPAPSGARPSVDPMLFSVARTFGAGAAAIVLSGMGRDGAQGAAAVAQAGGLVLAQDAASSVVWGMPGAVVAAGVAEASLPPVALAARIGRWRDAAGDGPWT